jgi:hypothetical protein
VLSVEDLYPSWASEAPCEDTELMFPHTTAWISWRAQRAKEVCRPCSFKRECLEWCYTEFPIPAVRDSRADGPERIDNVRRDSSAEGVWGGTMPAERRLVRHLPVPVRIEILLGRSELESLNGSAPSRVLSCAREIITTWVGLGSPPVEPARTFRHVARAFGGSTVTAARRQVGITAEREASEETGRISGWRWRFADENGSILRKWSADRAPISTRLSHE